MPRKALLIEIVIVFVTMIVAGALYERIVPGLSSARTQPSQVEAAIATWLLHHSVPEAVQGKQGPQRMPPSETLDLLRK